ncbi:MAG: hypothetical protein WC819_05720 [Parcubacteria group bacterium]|jgi:hypothetical protein
MEGKKFETQMQVNLHKNNNIGNLDKNKSEGQKKLTFEEAEEMYNEGAQLRERVIHIAEQDLEYCYEVFKEVHTAFFGNMDKWEVSRHITHRILMGTMISKNEEQSLIIYDDVDKVVFEKFLVPASNVSSKLEVEKIVKQLISAQRIERGVQ